MFMNTYHESINKNINIILKVQFQLTLITYNKHIYIYTHHNLQRQTSLCFSTNCIKEIKAFVSIQKKLLPFSIILIN